MSNKQQLHSGKFSIMCTKWNHNLTLVQILRIFKMTISFVWNPVNYSIKPKPIVQMSTQNQRIKHLCFANIRWNNNLTKIENIWIIIYILISSVTTSWMQEPKQLHTGKTKWEASSFSKNNQHISPTSGRFWWFCCKWVPTQMKFSSPCKNKMEGEVMGSTPTGLV